MSATISTYWAKKSARQTNVNPFAKKVTRLIRKKSLKILDLGCGFGEDSLYFASHGFTVTAVDFSKTGLNRLKAEAKTRGIRGMTLLQKDISEKLPFPTSSFDVVYAHLAVHFFDDPTTKNIFAEIARILKSGGTLFVKCKSVEDSLYGKGKKVGDDMFHFEHTRHFFSKQYMQEKLQNFRILSVRKASSRYIDMHSKFIEAVAKKK